MAEHVPGYIISDGGLYVPQAVEYAGPRSSQDPTITAWLRGENDGVALRAGVNVSPQSSMALSAYYACLMILAQDCAKLPLPVYQRAAKGRTLADDHWLWPILQEALNDDMTAYVGRETITFNTAGWGNGYAYIERDRSMQGSEGEVVGLYPIHPSRVVVERSPSGGLQYKVYRGATSLVNDTESLRNVPDIVDAADMLHLKGLSDDGLVGHSIARIAAESLGLSLASQRFGAAFFENGASLGGVLEHPGTLSEGAANRARESFQARYGGPRNAGKVAVLEEGMRYQRIGIPPNEAQFIETRAFQGREVCRWFRMQPHKIGDLEDAHHTNIEQQNIEHIVDTMMPWHVRWEQEINRKLLKGTPYYVKHDVRALLRGDSAARAAYYQALFQIAAYSPNQILELEEMEPYVGGDERFLQIQYAPVRKIVDGTARRERTPERPRQQAPMSPADPEALHRNGHPQPSEDPYVDQL